MEKLIQAINRYVNTEEKNRLPEFGGIHIFMEPLVAVAQASDPLFGKLRNDDVVDSEHLLPEEVLPGARSVISYFLPFSEEIRKANRKPGLPAQQWLYGRIEGEQFNETVRTFLAAKLQERGSRAVAPALDSRFRKIGDLKSNWSERHIAFIAGLGTFGLHKSFITEKGSAGRFGSVVTDMELPVTERRYQGIYDNCSWHREGKCSACISRCPAGAISEQGKDKVKCRNYVHDKIEAMFAPRFGCGKCQTGVPCEIAIP